jgi:hypothetical protein
MPVAAGLINRALQDGAGAKMICPSKLFQAGKT